MNKVVISYLEMIQPPKRELAPLEVLRAAPFPPWYFLTLYREVGADYEWVDMLQLSEEEVAAYCSDPNKSLYTVIENGVPAGFGVLNEMGAITDLAYFGLIPHATARGLGGIWLDYMIAQAWKKPNLKKLTVNTCTLDHPRALPLYLSRGFVVSKTHEK